MSNDHIATLVAGIERWRKLGIEDYWVRVGYMGADLSKVGEHEVTFAEDKLWHSKDGGDWIEIPKGSARWLFGVAGTFVWARDIVGKVLPKANAGADALELRCNEDFGYVEFLRVTLAQRDSENLTLEVKDFGIGAHPEL